MRARSNVSAVYGHSDFNVYQISTGRLTAARSLGSFRGGKYFSAD